MVSSTRLLPLIPLLCCMSVLAACASSKPKPNHNWSSYDHYEDNDTYYTAPKGFGFCGGEMAICE